MLFGEVPRDAAITPENLARRADEQLTEIRRLLDGTDGDPSGRQEKSPGPHDPTSGPEVRRTDSHGYTGAGYVDHPESPAAGEAYDLIRSSDDVGNIAEHVGIRAEVIDQVKKHLFLTEHEVPVGPNEVVRGRFTPLEEIANLWLAATAGPLSGQDRHEFYRLIAHEYVESRLMEAGLPYRSAHPDAWQDGVNWPSAEHHGAHDLAPIVSPARPPFSVWSRWGLRRPEHPMADDLSNLDEFVAAALDGSRGSE
jgi:hypothetical protein